MPRIATALSAESWQASLPIAEPMAYHDATRSGFVALCSRVPGTDWANGWARLDALPERLAEGFAANANWYVSQAVFTRPDRGVVNVKSLALSFLDLDIYKMPLLKELSADWQLNLLLEHCYQERIPEPSIVVHSGRGFQAKWCYTRPVPVDALPRWQAVQRELYKRLRKFGADAGALDASRVLRLVGTVHQTSGAVARVVHFAKTPSMGGQRFENGVVGYDFDEFASTLLPLERPVPQGREAEILVFPNVIGGPSSNGNLKSLSARSLAFDRLRDLLTLADLRAGPAGLPSGSRDNFIFTGAAFLAQGVVSMRSFDSELQALVRRLAPSWSPEDVRNCVCSVRSRLNDAAHGKTVLFQGKPVDPRYRFRTETLLNRLEPSESEQRLMRTIFGPEEARRRERVRKAAQRQRDRAAGIVTDRESWRQAHEDKGVMAKRLREEGLPWDEVARQTGHPTSDAARMAAKKARM